MVKKQSQLRLFFLFNHKLFMKCNSEIELYWGAYII